MSNKFIELTTDSGMTTKIKAPDISSVTGKGKLGTVITIGAHSPIIVQESIDEVMRKIEEAWPAPEVKKKKPKPPTRLG